MTLRGIAFRNLKRRKAKALFVLCGVTISVATVVALITLGLAVSDAITHNLEKFGANILVVPKTENLSLSYGGLTLGGVSFQMEQIRQSDLNRVSEIENSANVAAVGPMVLGVVEVNRTRVLLAGVDFETVNILKPWWKVRGALPQPGGILLGGEAGRVLGNSVGESVDIGGRRFTVSGILEPTGSQDDNLMFTHLEEAQDVLGMEGRVSMVEIAALCKDCPIGDMVLQLSRVLPGANVMAIQQVVKNRMETLRHFRNFSLAVSAVVLLVGTLLVLVTIMGGVRERTSEIGIFRAIGFRRLHVVRIVLMEAGVLSFLGGLFGYALGWAITRAVLPFFAEGHGLVVPVNAVIAGASLALALFMGLSAGVYPAVLAARMDPSDSLRSL